MEPDGIWKSLNEYQKEAVLDESKACLVKANVGSGKTTVLVEKVLYLHDQKGVLYEKMVVLTFTNKAADEIRQRLCVPDAAALFGFGTFHSVALRLLRDRLPVEELGYRKDFTVIDPEEELSIAESLIAAHKLKVKYPNRLKKRLEQEKRGWQQGKETSRYRDDLFRLFELLQEEKIRQNKLSFSDLISACTRLVKEHPDWIIVDEVQDSDKQQLELMEALMGEHTRLFAVGDPNQVIYSWRGSEENIFFLLARQFGARELTLPVNYRSGGCILEAARCFQQSGDRLLGTRGEGERIHVKNHYDPFSEAEYLAQRIAGLKEKGIAYREIAVFYRLQTQSELLEKVFARHGIPCTATVKKTLSDLPALAWFVKVLRFSCNRQDRFIEKAVLADRQYGTAPGLSDKMRGFEQWAGQRPSCAGWEPQDIYDYFELDAALKPSSAAFSEEKEQILSFCRQILEYVRRENLDFLPGLRAFLNSAALYGVNFLQEEAKEQEDAVRLMTLHASKGLEFRCVFIIGVNYGLIPLQSKTFEEEEEERRLFFVGITRARDYLELSWYTNPAQARAVSGASRYLDMIPEHLLDREDQKTKETADLAALRRAVQESKQKKSAQIPEAQQTEIRETKQIEEPETPSAAKRVRHDHYGVGIVRKEEDTKITVEFENYGVKEFIKAFTKLTEVL
ncbi:MAG: ATP-dependent helicase [Eubacteriales bacterium]|nr:ATP-dependent helicase [Eubacteriales bacterium]